MVLFQIILNVLGVVCTVDHEVDLRPCKICNWLLNSSHDHFGLHRGEIIRVDMEIEVPKKHLVRPTPALDMVQWVLLWGKQKEVLQ